VEIANQQPKVLLRALKAVSALMFIPIGNSLPGSLAIKSRESILCVDNKLTRACGYRQSTQRPPSKGLPA
jgi:hypothetical protein